MSKSPVRIAIVNDYEIVVAGTAAVLAPFEDRVRVVELDSSLPVKADVDVVLYDSFGQAQGSDVDAAALMAGGDARLVIFSWNIDPDLVDAAFDAGAVGYIAKGVAAHELVALIEAVHRGERVHPSAGQHLDGEEFGRWPGQDHGLSPREAEVLALICQGLSNQEITERAFLGLNTVKTYIRTLYRKIGVDSRTRALLWGIDHGFRPDRSRRPGPHA
ncbi:Transcriptional regulatory protein LiaR [Nocardioides dokdonensis FR1436]|uniref:Transcriptional regulatory protein LiaR n=1 Tax=Nocardioides dokdonensis FR1436 TaxID=1300347 RepID=A0A1A9GK43_9ACTN|nr:response regulator transcription factor [Nocardioides dokdonensis]ANH38050.1 Transcriptional regulatory protein LiaR [Nocardioides dokdonensis FR1436]